MGLGETVINVGTQRMKRNLAFLVLLGTGKLGAVQTARTTNLDAFRTAFHGGLDGALHRTAERDTLHQLLRNRLADQLRVDFHAADFLHFDQHFLVADDLGEDFLDLVKARAALRALFAFRSAFGGGGGGRSRCRCISLLRDDRCGELAGHDDARAPREDRNTNALRKALDHNLAHCRAGQFFRQFLPDLQVLLQQRPKLGLAGEPAGFPVLCYWKTKVRFLM